MEILMAWGIPTAITGLLIWLLKRWIDNRDKKKEELDKQHRVAAEEREKNIERMMLMIMQTGRATVILAEATARAVQRIPDAHCNGDMTSALERAAEIQKEEQQFLMDHGIKHIFGD